MPVLNLTPQNANYSVSFADQVLTVDLRGGASRRRRDVLGSNSSVNVSWVLLKSEYDYLMAFYRASTNYGSTSFEMSLILDNSTMTNYTCFFKAPPSLGSVDGGIIFNVSTTLEVASIVNSSSADEDFMMVEFEGQFPQQEDLINTIINYRLAS